MRKMKSTVNMKVAEAVCTGCGACVNSCPTDAITMQEDEEGFLYPNVNEEKCIECGKCLKICPVCTYENQNANEPEVCAVRASDDIRAVSSSGGVFSVLANEVLDIGGIVCGAAFDENMILSHILIEKEDIKRLRGAKYLQSNVKDIYQKIERELKLGRTVLFTGTPCQNAALRNVLGKAYDNLLMVDLICHGVPSQEVFSRHLKEIAKGRKIKRVDFRNKQFGWQSGKVLVEFEDETEYVGTVKNDAFEVGFYKNLILRKSCSECKYSAYPREGDLSIGDFWGISEIDASQNDGKGTSIVFINNGRGKIAFEKAADKFYEVKRYEFATVGTKIKNRVNAHYPANQKRDEFFHILKREKNLYKAVKMTLPDSMESTESVSRKNYDVGLVSNYLAVNFGGSLTQYALYAIIKKMGYTVGMIERPLEARGKVGKDTFSKYI